ncbi:hypothetical protein N7509_005690 [Penicillium cosmopolitanum]|uniref:Rhodopsin domain-containing protein n=1 Tax=Penicillium cosmopolitanum TaxID=1131564 RepID=A0A9X0BAC1_9EURO|nr:uncharacterized protein N7509_005690 [Penicillium cosmopolitanum]KAJ5397577.1 hypothetical protein N7509_005690 [Penicillium cosmopolitanum]
MTVISEDIHCSGTLLIRTGVTKAELKYSGIGYHIAYLNATNPNLIVLERKFRLMQAYIYVVTANLPKISILILYRRLFTPTILRLISTAMIWVLAIVIVVKILLVSFVCRPFAANWDQDNPGSKCLNMQSVSSLSTLPNIITDVVMLLLPVPVIWSLHTKLITKIQLTFTFALGSLGLITSILRFQFFFVTQSYDVTWSAIHRSIWTEVEPAVYLICACIITYKPLFDCFGIGGVKEGLFKWLTGAG